MTISSAMGTAGLKAGVVENTAGRPSSPYEGQVIFQKDTDQLLVWNGTAWVIPNQTTQNPEGLELIKTQTIGSAVSNVVITDAFSSTYENYRITVTVESNSNTNNSLGLRLRNSSGTDSSSNYFYAWVYGNPSTGGVSAAGNSSGSFFDYTVNFSGTSGAASSFDLFRPFYTTETTIVGMSPRGDLVGSLGGIHKLAASYPSFNLISGGGTFTGGTIRVYGYRNS